MERKFQLRRDRFYLRLEDHSARHANRRAAVLDEFVARTEQIHETGADCSRRNAGEVNKVLLFGEFQDIVRNPSNGSQWI